MHILATEIASLEEAEAAVDLGQSPADVVVMSFSDSDLSAAAAAWEAGGVSFSLRLADLKRLKHPMSVDLYIDRVLAHAKVIVIRCLGGLEYWRYGLESVAALARARGILLAVLPGDDRPDSRLVALSTMPPDVLGRLDRYFRSGGAANLTQAFRYMAALQGEPVGWDEPHTLGPIVRFHADGTVSALPASDLPERTEPAFDEPEASPSQELAAPLNRKALEVAGHGAWQIGAGGRPIGLIIFYRAQLLAGDTAPISALMDALVQEGLSPLALALTSLKDPTIIEDLQRLIAARSPSVILNTTAFSALRDDGTTVLDMADVPVLQLVLAGSTRQTWDASMRGLSAADQAMNVVLPELDGRLLTRAISFKDTSLPDSALEYACVRHQPVDDRIAYVAKLAAAWARLGRKPRLDRRFALLLSDYPARGGRAGYAVGLDTAKSVERITALLQTAGFDVGQGIGAKDVEALLNGCHGEDLAIPLATYAGWFAALPPELQNKLTRAWGEPAADPAFHENAFRFRLVRAGKLVIVLQPDRGANEDRKSGYHDSVLPPRHAYFAFYTWLREVQRIDALIHLGTHGTLEWLPGKALALSENCWPEAVLGPVPVIYPFIVNNPGEAVQAKRRIGAVTIGHMLPPVRKAGLHGRLAELECLVEEYASADGLDRRRSSALEQAIMDAAHASGFAAECGLSLRDTGRDAIARLDARLCDIKELSIQDSFHIYASSPADGYEVALAKAMAETGFDSFSAGREWAERVIAISADREGEALIRALDGRRVPPGPAGSPARGRFDVLPTGRNLTSIDPRSIPSRTAATIGRLAAEEVIRRYLQDHGEYPRGLVLTMWASPSLRTGGDDLAQALHYLGAVPVWDAMSSRVTGVEILPLAKLGRPRIDVTLRISGLFRDLFEPQIALFDLAVRQIAARDESDADNPLAEARRNERDLSRIFGGPPRSYGAGVADIALDTAWKSRAQLGRAALANVTHCYAAHGAGEVVPHDGFAARIAASNVLVQPQDTERDVLAGEEVADYAGSMAAAAALLGAAPVLYHLDTTRPMAPCARSMAESIARIVHGRLTNPRWLAGMLQHGHRGIAEIAQGVDALYVFAATTGIVPPHLFDAVHEAVIADGARLSAMIANNPAAAQSIALRLKDALDRGLWVAKRNAVGEELSHALMFGASGKASFAEAAE